MSYERFKEKLKEVNARLMGLVKLRSFIDVRNEKNSNPRTALQKALERKDPDRIRIAMWLIQLGADPSKVTDTKLRQEAQEIKKRALELQHKRSQSSLDVSDSISKEMKSTSLTESGFQDKKKMVVVDAMMSTMMLSEKSGGNEVEMSGGIEHMDKKDEDEISDVATPTRPVPGTHGMNDDDLNTDHVDDGTDLDENIEENGLEEKVEEAESKEENQHDVKRRREIEEEVVVKEEDEEVKEEMSLSSSIKNRIGDTDTTNDSGQTMETKKEEEHKIPSRKLRTKKEKRPGLCCGGGANSDDCAIS